jgi:hypothetical protein
VLVSEPPLAVFVNVAPSTNGPALAGHGAQAVRDAIVASIKILPEQLRRSLTWDQGAELAQHAQLRIDTGLQVFFCDPRSPWQRGINQNNGLLRQYLPKAPTSASTPPATSPRSPLPSTADPQDPRLETPAEALDELLSNPSTTGGVATTP